MLHAFLKRMAAFLKKIRGIVHLIYAAVAGYEKSSIVAVQSAQLSSCNTKIIVKISCVKLVLRSLLNYLRNFCRLFTVLPVIGGNNNNFVTLA